MGGAGLPKKPVNPPNDIKFRFVFASLSEAVFDDFVPEYGSKKLSKSCSTPESSFVVNLFRVDAASTILFSAATM